ncbi:MAG: hypothetical protein IT458_04965 [Planctomycetes bacterium]|nr:hypothetical protein [Planctomycetota bacterium]
MSRGCAPLLALALAACWSQQVATETVPLPSDPPPLPRERSGTPGATRPNLAIPTLRSEAAGLARESVPGGLTILARDDAGARGPTATIAHAVLLLPVGRNTGKPGLADLATWMLLEAADGGAPSLQRRVQALGGGVEFWVSGGHVRLSLEVPAAEFPAALGHLAAALARPVAAPAQLERLRARARRALTGEALLSPLLWTGARVLGNQPLPPEEFVAALAQRTPEEVEEWHRLLLRPFGAVLAVSVPGRAAEDALALARNAVQAWTGTTMASPAAAPPPEVPTMAGLVFVPLEVPLAEIALLAPLPLLGAPQAAETQVLLECLSAGGVGGRAGEQLRRVFGRELALETRTVLDGPRRFAAFTARVPVAEAPRVVEALRAALASLVARTPRDDEAGAALLRVRLAMLAEEESGQTWLLAAAARTLARVEDRAWRATREALLEARAPELGGAAAALGDTCRIVVVGGNPGSHPGASELDDAFPQTLPLEDEGGAAVEIGAARPLLDLATEALGGRDALAAVRGWQARARVESPLGATAGDELWFALPDRFRRRRTVLATTIETVASGTGGSEAVAGERVELPAAEAQSLARYPALHPLLLLGAVARGESAWRLVGVHRRGGRELGILEAVDDTKERTRLWIDAESGLPRRLETHEWRHGVGRVSLAAEFDDYRAVSGLRAPFRMRVQIDGGRDAVTTIFQTFLPSAPAPAALQLGGPPGDLR